MALKPNLALADGFTCLADGFTCLGKKTKCLWEWSPRVCQIGKHVGWTGYGWLHGTDVAVTHDQHGSSCKPTLVIYPLNIGYVYPKYTGYM